LKIKILFLFILLSPFTYSQGETDQQLAQLYYTKGEFVKALGYYEKLYTADPSKFYFNRYLDCLIATDQRKDAEKLLKKQAAANRFDSEYKVRLGQFYEDGAEADKAQKIYSELIDELAPDAGQIIQLYNAFKSKGRNDLALRTLETGRKLLKETYPLHFQFAELYGAMGQTEKMIAEYLDLLDFYSSYYQTLQTVLTAQFDLSAKESKEFDMLKNALLERVQKKPNDTVYAEMLIWLFLQRKNFNAALTQAQALDKRQGEQGLRVIDVAKICVENRDYETARKGFKYVISLGEDKSYYYEAERALLNTRFLEVTTNRNFSTEELNQTIQEYRTTLERIGQKRSGVPLTIELSHILAFYANQSAEAIEMLTRVLAIAGLTDMQKAEIKMELGDIQVLHGDIWEASLLYMQIENAFKFEPIGNEAKYKNARIFYYDGEFDFAQSQLNVLKESTSKLIANDAMQLSLLITDNFGLDSNYQAMTWFANADLLIEQHQYSQAFALFDSIIKNYPYHSLGDEILLRKSKAMQQQGQWTEAVRYLEELLKYHREDILADDAIFQLGELHELHLNNLEKAAEYYKTLLFDFKGSLYAEEARKRFRALRGDVPDENDAQ
jgi:tetratricopeptide (TPR) repeat protein